jgi:hypothetical protein
MARHVDHLVIPVRDLENSARRLESAGFVVTPQADHPFGTSNRLVVFDRTYLEFVAVTRPDLVPEAGFAAEVSQHLDAAQGISHLVLATGDAATDHARLAAAGIAAGPVFDFSRPAPRADGTTVTASFSLATAAATTPPGVFLCAHHTPGAVWHRSHLAHPNGAERILAIRLPGEAPEAVALFDLTGVEFGAAAAGVTTDGRHGPVRLGGLTIDGFAADSGYF